MNEPKTGQADIRTQLYNWSCQDADHEGCVHFVPVEIFTDSVRELDRLRAENAELKHIMANVIEMPPLNAPPQWVVKRQDALSKARAILAKTAKDDSTP